MMIMINTMDDHETSSVEEEDDGDDVSIYGGGNCGICVMTEAPP